MTSEVQKTLQDSEYIYIIYNNNNNNNNIYNVYILYIANNIKIKRELVMNCERHAASTELCLTFSKVEVSLRFPSEKS